MADLLLQADLMKSLARLVRGLSALFWGLPLTLLVCAKTATSEWLRPFGVIPPVATTALLLYGLLQLGHFQKQERVWTEALDRAKLLAIVNIGLSPFVYWWNQIPTIQLFSVSVGLLMLSGLLFLFNLNQVLQRLAAMLPDETLRIETRFFTSMNLYLLAALMGMIAFYLVIQQIDELPALVIDVLQTFEVVRQWTFMFLVLLPLAMTMTLIWKIKEMILSSVFGQDLAPH